MTTLVDVLTQHVPYVGDHGVAACSCGQRGFNRDEDRNLLKDGEDERAWAEHVEEALHQTVVGLDTDDLATVIAALELTVEVDRDEYPDAAPLLDRLVARLNGLIGEPVQKPRLMMSPLTEQVYLVTRYTTYGDPEAGLIEAQEKYPVDREELIDVIRRSVPEPDNHHNADVCPYCCTPRSSRLDPRNIDNGGTHG